MQYIKQRSTLLDLRCDRFNRFSNEEALPWGLCIRKNFHSSELALFWHALYSLGLWIRFLNTGQCPIVSLPLLLLTAIRFGWQMSLWVYLLYGYKIVWLGLDDIHASQILFIASLIYFRFVCVSSLIPWPRFALYALCCPTHYFCEFGAMSSL